MKNTQAQVTNMHALRVASVFLTHPNVRGVEVVGSVARTKRGNDLDLVVVANPLSYTTFVLSMQAWTVDVAREADDYYYSNYKGERFAAALEALQFDAGFRGWLRLATQGIFLDVHVMPEGWREHTEEIQQHLPHNDPHFVRNIAKDAVSLRPAAWSGVVKEATWP